MFSQFNDEEADNLKDIYNSDWSNSNNEFSAPAAAAARNLDQASPLADLVNKAVNLIN